MINTTVFRAVLAAVLTGMLSSHGAENSPQPITLQEAINKVVIHNESLQSKLLDAEIARRQYKAEKGIFEPAVVGSYQHNDSERENTLEQQAALGALGAGHKDYFERDDLFNGGLELLSPVGSRFRLGYDMRRLHNTLNASIGREYVSSIGATLTQPLLKNFGIAATMARIRLAAINSDIAYQEYRRQLMLTLARTESGYWDLYFAQEQERISRESVDIADALYKDNKARFEAGKSAELEVLEAQAGVSLRAARKNDAAQKLNEAGAQLSTLISGPVSGTGTPLRAVDTPKIESVSPNYYEEYRAAFENNPDYISRKYQAVAENVRFAYTKNQSLPELDLKASYGLNGLGSSIEDSHEDLDWARFPAWSVGLELRIPITGGIRERNELKAAELSKKKALVNLKEIEVQMANALSTAILKVNNLSESITNHRSVISFHQQLLENQLARLEAGVIDSKTVLETEDKLFDARIALLENIVAYQKALVELDLVKGTTLLSRHLEITKAELQQITERLLASNRYSGPELQALRREIDDAYKERIRHLDAREKPESMLDALFK